MFKSMNKKRLNKMHIFETYPYAPYGEHVQRFVHPKGTKSPVRIKTSIKEGDIEHSRAIQSILSYVTNLHSPHSLHTNKLGKESLNVNLGYRNNTSPDYEVTETSPDKEHLKDNPYLDEYYYLVTGKYPKEAHKL